MTPAESLNYFDKLNRLTSTNHKMILLKVLHGDIYTNERLFRFGLSNSELCVLCGQDDNIEHRLTTCNAYSRLIDSVLSLTNTLSKIPGFRHSQCSRLEQVLATHRDVDNTTLTIHACLVNHLIYQREVIPPRVFIDRILSNTLRNETRQALKDELITLLHID